MKTHIYFFCLFLLFFSFSCTKEQKKEELSSPKQEQNYEPKAEEKPSLDNTEEIGGAYKQQEERVETNVKDTNSKVSNSELEKLKENLKK
ncbi:MAG: hypothetical protein OHK0045_04680 [Raineya sp.]